MLKQHRTVHMGFAMMKHDLQMCGIVPFTISVSQTDLLELLISLKDYRFNADFRSVSVLKRLLHLEDSYSVVLVRPCQPRYILGWPYCLSM